MSLEWPPEFTLFLDRGASVRRLTERLTELQIPFARHDDIFPQDAADTTWLTEVGQRGWYVLTLDQRIRYNPLEKAALLRSGIGSFILIAKNLSGQRIAECIVTALPAMLAFARRTPRPFIAKIYADSRILPLEIA